MRSMEGRIPPLRGIEVGVDVVKSPRSYDLALITRFDSLADIRAYQAHPYHQNVVLKHVNEVTEFGRSRRLRGGVRYAIVCSHPGAMEFHQVTSIDYSQRPPPPALSREAEWLRRSSEQRLS